MAHWTWLQDSGALIDPEGFKRGHGYSGHGEGINNDNYQQVRDVGPIPVGRFYIGPWFDDEGGVGPVVARLVPTEGTDVFGRDDFMIHGDNEEMNRTASDGCIVLNHTLRCLMRDSGVHKLLVEQSIDYEERHGQPRLPLRKET